MSRRITRRWTSLLLVAALAVFAAVGTWWSPVARAGECVAAPVTDAVLNVSVSPGQVYVGQPVTVTFFGSLPDGHCAGDTITIATPGQLDQPAGTSYALRAPDGSLVATMTTGPGQVVITFTDYVQTHQDVRFTGWLTSTLVSTPTPGEPMTLEWSVNGTTITAPLTGLVCTVNCTALPTTASKWATDTRDGHVISGLVSAPLPADADGRVLFTDTLGAGQELVCSDITAGYFTSRGADGSYGTPTPLPVTVDACDATTLSATVTGAPVGAVVALFVTARITDPTLASYADAGTVTVMGATTPVQAQTRVYAGGGDGSGSLPTTTPTPTTPTPTETTANPTPTQTSEIPTPTPTRSDVPIGPSATPTTSTPTSSTSSPTVSPSSTATPTGRITPHTVPTATGPTTAPTTTVTTRVTSTATVTRTATSRLTGANAPAAGLPVTTYRQAQPTTTQTLARTGAEVVGSIALGTILFAGGLSLMLAARRRRDEG